MSAQSELRFTLTVGLDGFEVVESHFNGRLSSTNPPVDFGQVLRCPILPEGHQFVWKRIVAELPRAEDYS